MKVTYDSEADAAYVAIVDAARPGDAVAQVEVDDPRLLGQLVIDLDPSGRILGFEIFSAGAQVDSGTLASAATDT